MLAVSCINSLRFSAFYTCEKHGGTYVDSGSVSVTWYDPVQVFNAAAGAEPIGMYGSSGTNARVLMGNPNRSAGPNNEDGGGGGDAADIVSIDELSGELANLVALGRPYITSEPITSEQLANEILAKYDPDRLGQILNEGGGKFKVNIQESSDTVTQSGVHMGQEDPRREWSGENYL